MSKKLENGHILGIIAVSVALVGLLSRLGDIPNLTALPAIALLLGAFARSKKWSIAIIFSIMFVSDIYFGFYYSIWAVYLSYFLMIGMGRFHKKIANGFGSERINKIIGAGVSAVVLSTAASAMFFLITNAAVWIEGFIPGSVYASYSKGFDGLIASYSAGLAFAREFGYPVFTGTIFLTVPTFIIYSILEKEPDVALNLDSIKEANID